MRERQNWIVDPCPDANGFHTIRIADGSEHGNTEEQPIATVFEREIADHIVTTHNNAGYLWPIKAPTQQVAEVKP